MSDSNDQRGKNAQCPPQRKSAYTVPTLTRFGAVQGLTLGSGGSRGDGQLGMTRGGMMNMNMGMGMGMN